MLSKTKVFWTYEEVQKLASAAHSAGISSDDSRIIIKLRRLQSLVLPVTRCKAMTNSNSSVKVREEMLKLENRPKTKPVEIQENIVHEHKVETLAVSSIDSIIESLAKELVKSFVGHLRIALSESVEDDLSKFLPAKGIIKSHKKRILVIGLMPQQAAIINLEYGNKFDIRFEDSSVSPGALKGKADTMDTVLGMVNFMGHDQQDMVRYVKDYRRVAGGLSSLRDILTKELK